MLKNLNKVKIAYTHAGVFHADDVFSVALLKMINPRIIIERVLQPPEDTDNTIIFDIGFGRYDHHQEDKCLRSWDDGLYYDKTRIARQIPYCSFGLLWRDFGRLLCPSEKAWKKVDRDLVMGIDKADNGCSANALASAIGALNPVWDDEDTLADSCFETAVDLAYVLLRGYVRKANAETRAESLVLNSRVIDGKILVLERYAPWQEVVSSQMLDILYCVFPSNRGGYNVQTVPIESGSFIPRKGFPEEWLGKPVESLGMTFCHPGNFILSCRTLEQAIACAQIAVGNPAA